MSRKFRGIPSRFQFLDSVGGESLLELWGTTFLHNWFLSDLLQNHMSISRTIRAHAKEVWDKLDKD